MHDWAVAGLRRQGVAADSPRPGMHRAQSTLVIVMAYIVMAYIVMASCPKYASPLGHMNPAHILFYDTLVITTCHVIMTDMLDYPRPRLVVGREAMRDSF